MKYIDTTVSESFREEVSKPDSVLSLARAGLYFAKSRYSNVDCFWYLEQLALAANEILKQVSEKDSFERKLSIVTGYLFDELGYEGNAENYYDPKNSYLHEVIERRVGIPISLSVIFLDIADRVGINAVGVPFPGHFLVRASDPKHSNFDPMIVDPFDGGSCLSQDLFVSRFQDRLETPRERAEVEAMLRPASKKEIIIRQFRNLLAIYSNEKSFEECLLVVNHILYLAPDMLNELLHRGGLFSEMGHPSAAIIDFERALTLSNDPELTQKLHTLIHDAKLQRKPVH